MPRRPTGPPPRSGPRFLDTEQEYDETPTGNHRIVRDGTRLRKNGQGNWEFDAPDVETDPHPSGPRDAGKSAGQFLGGLIDGIRDNVKPSTLALLAVFFGLGGGFGGQKLAEATAPPTPSGGQIEVLLHAIQRQNLELANLEQRIQQIEVERDMKKTLPEIRDADTAAAHVEAATALQVSTENEQLAKELEGAQGP